MILLYLGAIIVANLTIATLGAAATPFVAFLLIGFDLVARDRLHDRWQSRGVLTLTWRMAGLIAAGGALSYLLNQAAGPIAVASVVSFTAAALVDTAIYTLLRDTPALVRTNGSNVPSAAVDSLLFPMLAFGGFPLAVIIAQFAAKTLGGLLWSALLYKRGGRDLLPRHAQDDLAG